MQEKYTATANKVGISYLVSALNILNEAEINFKMARNKRLHVELTLIKLNFLQQAIELSADNGTVVKKKRIDGPVAFRIQPIAPMLLKTTDDTASAGSKLYIEQKPAPPAPANSPANTVPRPITPATVPPANSPRPVSKPAPPQGNKKNLLDALREKYGDQYAIEEVKEAEVLKMDKLRECWDAYTAELERQKKHSSVGTFKIAVLTIENDIRFTVSVPALTAQKFVEQERMMLIDHLHQAFNNRSISFSILVDASEKEEVPAHMRMNSKEKFERIAEQYPLVKELRDKLKLEIDY